MDRTAVDSEMVMGDSLKRKHSAMKGRLNYPGEMKADNDGSSIRKMGDKSVVDTEEVMGATLRSSKERETKRQCHEVSSQLSRILAVCCFSLAILFNWCVIMCTFSCGFREIQAESGGLSHRKMDETVADNEKVMGVTAKQKKTNRKFMNVCAVDTDQRAQKENLINAAADELMEHGAKNTRKKKRKKGSKTAKNTSEKLSECHGVKSDHENSDTCQKVALPGKRVCIKYTGRLKDGRVFETTVGGKPLRFRLGEGAVLAGLDISIDGMVVGEKKKLTIPPSLGFGEQMLWDIPPNSKLEFDLELIDVED